MQLFGATIPKEERSNYSNFGVGFLTTFQILTGEDWNAVMYSAKENGGGWAVSPYFFVVSGFGAFVVLNLFVVILLSPTHPPPPTPHSHTR